MTNFDRDIQRKLRALRHAEQIGDVSRACRYFGISRASFYRWKAAFQRQGEAGLVNRKPAPKNPANRTAPEIVEKVLLLRQTYHLGPIRIVWYLARYHGIKISDAGVYRILRRHGLNRLRRGTRVRKIPYGQSIGPTNAPSGRLTMIVAQEPAQSLAALHRPLALTICRQRKQQDVALPLVIPLGMEMVDVFAQRPPQGAFAEQDHLRQALLLDRPHPALGVGIQIRAACRQCQRLNPT